jgi:UDP-N-acetylglucosamine 2-epimerase
LTISINESKNYYSIIREVDCVLGNSSSGIIEAPYYKIPSINIGDRQKGRIRHKSIIDTNYDIIAIKKAIKKASSRKFRKQIENMTYKFGEGNTAKKMVEIIKKINFDEKFLTKKLT